MGDAPYLCDAVPSDEGKKLFEKSEKIDFSRAALLNALDTNRTVTLRYADGRLTDNLIYQLRRDNDCEWLFVCHDAEPLNKDVDNGKDIRITVDGEFVPELYDTQSGEILPLGASYLNGKTVVPYKLYGYDSVLIKLSDGNTASAESVKPFDKTEGKTIRGKVDYELDGKNVLLLDTAEFKLSGESEFSAREELLRLDNICRERLGLPLRGGSIVQPWVSGDIPPVDKLTLRFNFDSEINYSGAFLAFEEPDRLEKILFNGFEVAKELCGNYVDISIFKIKLPDIVKGENTLEMTYAYGEKTDIENVFILGDFGVKVNGTEKTVVPLPKKIGFGDITSQGFPFYGDNITYKFKAESSNGKLRICSSWYRGAMISVKVDGEEKGNIVYPPYALAVDGLPDGEHDVELTLYTHRYNTFGPLHLVNVAERWHGPDAWRSKNNNWCYEYVLRPVGILAAPKINS